jgi:hypothetical protein
MLHLLKRDLKLGRKGRMSKLGDVLMASIEGISKGTLPLNTAKEIHLTAHRHVMDRYADVAVEKQGSCEQIEKAKALLAEV